MNKQNKNYWNSDSAAKSETKACRQSILKLTYLDYLKEQHAKKFIKNIRLNRLKDNGIYEGRVITEDSIMWKLVTQMTSNNPSIVEVFKFETKNSVDKEDEEVNSFVWFEYPRKAEISKLNSLRWKLRKYFLQNSALEKSNPYRKDEQDFMIDEFVVLEPVAEQNFHMDNKFKESLIDFAAGSLAGIAQVYVSQPLDTVKVKLQTFPKLYKNMFKCFVQTYQMNGISRGLYAGTFPAVIASIAENSVLFTAYGACQKCVAFVMEIDKVGELSVLGNAFAGFLAAFFTTFTLCPTELIKCKLQAIHEMKHYVAKHSKATPISAFKLTRDIFVNEGISGFYRGLWPTFVREMPGFFFFFGGYEATREFFTKPGESKSDIGPLKTMCAGAVGGITLWTLTFPADVIKSRIQINNLKVSMLSAGSDILRKEGILAFYNGLLPTILRTIPATATLVLVYEYSKKILTDKL